MEKAGVDVNYFRPTAFEGEFVNVFPKSDAAFAGSVDKTGEEKASDKYRTSPMISVNEGDMIYFAGCNLTQGYQLVMFDAAGAAAEATTTDYVSRFVDFGDGYGICAYKVRPGTVGVRIVAPADTYDEGKVFVTINQTLTLDAYNALMNPAPETTAPETTEAAPETTEPAPETTAAPETTKPADPVPTGDSALIFVVIAIISVASIAVVAKRREN
jgi:hypothetical protein